MFPMNVLVENDMYIPQSTEKQEQDMEHIFFKMNTFSSSPYPSKVKCKTLAAVAKFILSPQTNFMPTTYTQNESKEKKISRDQHSCMIVWRCMPGIHVQGNPSLSLKISLKHVSEKQKRQSVWVLFGSIFVFSNFGRLDLHNATMLH